MTYYLIEVSEKKVVRKISKPVVQGDIVYYNPFSGNIEVRYIKDNIQKHFYNIERETLNPKSVIFLLHLMGFDLKYDPETRLIEVKLPADKEKSLDVQWVYRKYFIDDSSFLYFPSFFPAENLSPLKYSYVYYRSIYQVDLITENVPNVLDNLELPDLVIPIPDTKI